METRSQAGKKLWVNVSILIFHDERTGRDIVVHMARDISARKQREDLTGQLVQMAKDVAALSEDAGGSAPVSPLTARERQVLRLLASGKSPTRAAQELKITPRTLRNHLHHANQKLNTTNRLEAVMQASRRKLI